MGKTINQLTGEVTDYLEITADAEMEIQLDGETTTKKVKMSVLVAAIDALLNPVAVGSLPWLATFTGVNGTLLTAYTPESGDPVVFGAGSTWEIQSNRAVPKLPFPGSGYPRFDIDPGPTQNYIIRMSVKFDTAIAQLVVVMRQESTTKAMQVVFSRFLTSFYDYAIATEILTGALALGATDVEIKFVVYGNKLDFWAANVLGPTYQGITFDAGNNGTGIYVMQGNEPTVQTSIDWMVIGELLHLSHFTAANGTLLSAYTPDFGSAFTLGVSSIWEIQSNKLTPKLPFPVGDLPECALAVAVQDYTINFVAALAFPAVFVVTLRKGVGKGVQFNISEGGAGVYDLADASTLIDTLTWTPSTTEHEYKIVITGTSYEFYRDGVLEGGVTFDAGNDGLGVLIQQAAAATVVVTINSLSIDSL